jgi:hypothetical protein
MPAIKRRAQSVLRMAHLRVDLQSFSMGLGD